MPKILQIPDQMYDKLIRASKNLDLSTITDSGNLQLLGDNIPILDKPNDILVILHLVSGMTGKNIPVAYFDELPEPKKKRSTKVSIEK